MSGRLVVVYNVVSFCCLCCFVVGDCRVLLRHCFTPHVKCRQINVVSSLTMVDGGVVVLSVEYRTCDQEVVGSSLCRACGVKTLGMFLTRMCLCSPSSTSWYRPKGGDALRLGSKGRHGLCAVSYTHLTLPTIYSV